MSWLSETAAESIESLATRSSPELLAYLLIKQAQERLEEQQRHADEIRRITHDLSDAHRAGLAVMRMRHQGRKTVRLTDLLGGTV